MSSLFTRLRAYLLALAAMLLAPGCDGIGSDGPLSGAEFDDVGPDAGAIDLEDQEAGGRATATNVQLLADYRNLNGFNTYSATPSSTPIGTLTPPTATAPPSWRLAEWHTQALLANGEPQAVVRGYQWANKYKRVIIDDGFLELAVNADAEYGGEYRQLGEPWPHLLVAQKIYDDANPAANRPVHELKRLELDLSLELVHATHLKEAGYDKSLHACQFLMFFTVQNRNKDHADYGNFIWIGLPFYDDRTPSVQENLSIDTGLGKYLYRMPASSFMPASLHNVSSVDISVDLAPVMKEKLEEAVAKGILKSKNLDDYYIGGMNMGFEVPGRSIATMRVRGLSAIATYPAAP